MEQRSTVVSPPGSVGCRVACLVGSGTPSRTNILEAERAGVGDRVVWRGWRGGTLGGAGPAGIAVVWDDGGRGVVAWHEAAGDVDVVRR